MTNKNKLIEIIKHQFDVELVDKRPEKRKIFLCDLDYLPNKILIKKFIRDKELARIEKHIHDYYFLLNTQNIQEVYYQIFRRIN